MRNNKGNNYLDLKPQRSDKISWSEQDGKVTLEIENKGFWNRAFQKLFKKPKISYVHLDELGSFVWPLIDGEKTVLEIGQSVEAEFGEKANPLYERLIKYFEILKSYHYVYFSNNVGLSMMCYKIRKLRR